MADNSNNYSEAALLLLKSNLNYHGDIPAEVEAQLRSLLEYAFQRLKRSANIQLTPGQIEDDMLQAMFASWVYLKGRDGAEKNPMLKEAIRDYQVSRALSEKGASV